MHTALLLEMAAGAFPDRTAIGPRAQGLTYAELMERARAGATLLAETGAEVVAFMGLNGATLPVTVFASGLLGLPFAPLNYRLPDAELRALLARTAPSTCVVDDDMLARVQGVKGVALIARSEFDAACDEPERRAAELPLVDPDIAVLLFTSGTTGQPKAAILRHRHLTSYVISTIEFMASGEEEAALVSVPPYHIAGISAVLTGVYSGRRVVYLSAFSAEEWVAAASTERVTHAMVVPTMLGRILDIIEKTGQGLPHLKALSYGGGRMPSAVIDRALRLLPHVDFVNAYGLTETSSTISVLTAEDHRRAFNADDEGARRRLGSVGRPLPNLELEIRGPSGELLPPGQAGEVWVRGEQISGEYLGKKVIRDDGWFPTNDAGWLDEDGYLFVDGRLDDVIVRGGENISPGEIEDVLRAHPMVADVAVLGLPDDRWGEKVAAVIVPRGPQPSLHELSAWVRARLRSTKTPELYEFRTALPYNETGKLLRRVLKQELSAPRAAGAAVA